jgi:hypothetical protein
MHWIQVWIPIQDDDRCVIGLLKIFPQSPLHTSCEVALICIPPSPDCSLVSTMCPAIFPQDVICRIAVVSVSTGSRAISETVSATPSAPVWTTGIRQTILNQIEEGWCFSFWDENRIGIRPERSSELAFSEI